jgi:HAMP domain-containing protein
VTDIVERLRNWKTQLIAGQTIPQILNEAANEIERLRKEVRRLNLCLKEGDDRYALGEAVSRVE